MTNPNESVTPLQDYGTILGDRIEYRYEGNGLTKRELFAAMAMQGILSNSSLRSPKTNTSAFAAYAADSVCYADALIEGLNRTEAK